MKKLILIAMLVFSGSYFITILGLEVLQSDESDTLNINKDSSDSIDDNKNNNESSIIEDVGANKDLLDEYKFQLKKELLDDASDKYLENEIKRNYLEEQIKEEIKKSIQEGSSQLDSTILDSIKEDYKIGIEKDIVDNIKENIKNEIELDVEKNVNEQILEEEEKLINISDAKLIVGNNIKMTFSEFEPKGILHDVEATDYEGNDITGNVNYKIIQDGMEVNEIESSGGDYLVIYYITGANNNSVIAYKKINIFIQLVLTVKDNMENFYFEQNFLGDDLVLPLKHSFFSVNNSVSGSAISSWNINSVDFTKNEIQEVTIKIYEGADPTNNDELIINFIPKGQFLDGNGSTINPFQIDDSDDLYALEGKILNSNFKLLNDIEAGDNLEYSPIKKLGQGYTFDGDNYVISNMTLEIQNGKSSGMFYLVYGTVKNIHFRDILLQGTLISNIDDPVCLISIAISYLASGGLADNLTFTLIEMDIKLENRYIANSYQIFIGLSTSYNSGSVKREFFGTSLSEINIEVDNYDINTNKAYLIVIFLNNSVGIEKNNIFDFKHQSYLDPIIKVIS